MMRLSYTHVSKRRLPCVYHVWEVAPIDTTHFGHNVGILTCIVSMIVYIETHNYCAMSTQYRICV